MMQPCMLYLQIVKCAREGSKVAIRNQKKTRETCKKPLQMPDFSVYLERCVHRKHTHVFIGHTHKQESHKQYEYIKGRIKT